MPEKQFAIDLTQPLTGKNQFVCAAANKRMRFWARNNGMIVIHDGRLLCRLDEEVITQELQDRYEHYGAQWFGEMENMRIFKGILDKHGYTIDNYGPFFTPHQRFKADKDLDVRTFNADEIQHYKGNTDFREAFLFDEQDPDLLGASIQIDGRTVALAGMNQNGQHVLEIGIEVLPEYRNRGYASRLVRAITAEGMRQFPDMTISYGTQFTHNRSINVAIQAGFKHTWTELVLKKTTENEEIQ